MGPLKFAERDEDLVTVPAYPPTVRTASSSTTITPGYSERPLSFKVPYKVYDNF